MLKALLLIKAIYTDSENIDPVGSCVGQRGVRIQTIINELGGEKIDIVEYSDDPSKYIANALAPAKILSIKTDDKLKRAIVKVDPDKLSLAIGKAGQNARLAARLTGWKIDILPYNPDEPEEVEEKKSEELVVEKETESEKEVESEKKEIKKKEKKEAVKKETKKKVVKEKVVKEKKEVKTKKTKK